MARHILMVAGFLAGLAPGMVQAAELVSNGSFEQVQIGPPLNSTNPADVPGWTHTGVPGDALLWAVGYSDPGGSVTVAGQGMQFVTAGAGFTLPEGVATWAQTVSGLTPGAMYDLRFMLSAEASFSGVQFVDVTASDTTFLPQQFVAPLGASNYWSGWTPFEVQFMANASATTLSFSSNTRFDVGLDNVSLMAAPIPEPETYALLLAGLGLVGYVARARKRGGT